MRFYKQILLIVVFALSGGTGYAQSDSESIAVSFSGDMCAEKPFAVVLNEVWVLGDGDDCGQYFPSDTGSAVLKPNNIYKLSIIGDVCSGHVSLTETHDCYDIYIDGVQTDSINTSEDGTWQVELRPASDAGGEPGGSGSGVGSFNFYVNLGSLPNGQSLGRLQHYGDVIPTDGFLPEHLIYTGPNPEDVESGMILEIIDQEGNVVSDYYAANIAAKETTRIVCRADVSGDLNDIYFDIYGADGENGAHRFWYNVDANGSAPSNPGSGVHEVAISAGDSESVIASATAVVIDGLSLFTATSSGDTLTVVDAFIGNRYDLNEGGTGFDFLVTTQGSYNTPIRQIRSDTILVDVGYDEVDDEVQIVFYKTKPVMTKTGNFYDPSSLGLAEFSRSEVKNVSETEFNFTTTKGNRSETATFTQDTVTGAWTRTENGNSESVARIETGSDGSYQRIETRTHTIVDDNNNDVVVKETEKKYKNITVEDANGDPKYLERLIRKRVDPDGDDEQVTIYKYYDMVSAPRDEDEDHSFKWGLLEYVVYPDGTWEKYDYDERDYDPDLPNSGTNSDGWLLLSGRKSRIYRPWKDLPAHPDAATDTNCHFTEYEYVNFRHDTQFANVPSSEIVNVLGSVVKKTLYGYDYDNNDYDISVYSTKQYLNSNNEYDASTYIESIKKSYQPQHPDWPSRPYSEQLSSGKMTSYAYEKGLWDETTKTFTVSQPGATVTARRISRIEGSSFTDQGESLTTVNGVSIEPLYCIANKSTKNERIMDISGRICYEANYVYKGGGDTWDLLDWKTHTYTAAGKKTRTDFSNGTYEEADWTDGVKQWETSVDGTKISYQYYPDGEIQFATVEGLSGVIGDLKTTFQYDLVETNCGCLSSEHRVISSTDPSETETLTTYSKVDGAGRRSQTLNANGVLVYYSYVEPVITIDDDFEVTAIAVNSTTGEFHQEIQMFPESRSTTTTNYLDGQVKNMTGNAAVDTFYDYSTVTVQGSDAHRVTSVTKGSASGLKEVETTQDWLGRKIKTSSPTFDGSGNHVVETIFDTTTGLATKSMTTGVAPTLFEYDNFGQMSKRGLDTDGTADQLDDVSEDRIDATQIDYAFENGKWYRRSVQTTFLADDSTGDKRVVTSMQQLTGLNATTGPASVHIVKTEYFYGASSTASYTFTTTTETEINRATKTVTVKTTPSNGLPQTRTTKNGYLTQVSHELPNSQAYTVDYAYDYLGRLQTTSDSTGYSQTHVYKPNTTLVQSSTATDIGTTTYTYNAAAEVNSEENELGYMTYYAYNGRGQVTHIWGDAVYPVRYEYDDNGRRTKMWTFRNNLTAFETDTWPTAEDPNGDLTEWKYNERTGLLYQKHDASSEFTEYAYDDANRLQYRYWARDKVGAPDTPLKTTYVYDDGGTGELTDIDYDDGTSDIDYTYDRVGRRKTITDASGSRTLTYRAGILEDETYTSGILSDLAIDRTINADAHTSEILLKKNSVGFYDLDYGYDATGRLETVTLGTREAKYIYKDNAQLLEDIEYREGTQLKLTSHREYERGRLLKKIEMLNAGSAALSRYTYQNDAMGRRDRRDDLDGDYWDYDYDSRNQLTDAVKYRPGTPDVVVPGYSFGFGFDGIGNRTQGSFNGVSSSYTPNSLNQYSQKDTPRQVTVAGQADTAAAVTVTTSVGNANVTRLDANYSAQADFSGLSNPNYAKQETVTVEGRLTGGGDAGADRVAQVNQDIFLSANPEIFAYDEDGNMTMDSRWQYTWNAENRLVEVESTAGAVIAGAPRQKVAYAYDNQGRMFQRDEFIWDVQTSSFVLTTTNYYLWDGYNRVARLDANKAIEQGYAWGIDLSGSMQGAGGVGGLALLEDGSQMASYAPQYDGNGNVTGYVDISNEQLVAEYKYGPFGESIGESGDLAALFDHRFSTKPTDAATRFVHYELRVYDADLGRWLSRDPIGERGGLNLFGFVGNSPVIFWDILGLYSSGGGFSNPHQYTGPGSYGSGTLQSVNAGPGWQYPSGSSQGGQFVRTTTSRGSGNASSGGSGNSGSTGSRTAGAAGGAMNMLANAAIMAEAAYYMQKAVSECVRDYRSMYGDSKCPACCVIYIWMEKADMISGRLRIVDSTSDVYPGECGGVRPTPLLSTKGYGDTILLQMPLKL
jgi:RHS repeat-associated protein